jgi:lysophospholipase L1-like esterase
MARTFERFVVMGDSTAEGVGDPDGAGGHRGFADRLAEQLAELQGTIAYANLAVSGSIARDVRDRQLAPALAMRPDLVVIMAGLNDLLRARFALGAIADDLAEMQGAFADAGCVVITFTVPDVAHRLVMPPLDRVMSRRTRALNAVIREVATATGALVIDLATHAMAADPRLWDRDRLHGNPDGHARIAAACAQALGLPGADDGWRQPLPALTTGRIARLAEDLAWGRDYLAPWLWRQMWRSSVAEQRVAKRPTLTPVQRSHRP